MFDSTNEGNLDIVTKNVTNLPQGLNCVTWYNVSPSCDRSAKTEADNNRCHNTPVECRVPCGWHSPVEESLLRPTVQIKTGPGVLQLLRVELLIELLGGDLINHPGTSSRCRVFGAMFHAGYILLCRYQFHTFHTKTTFE